MLRAGALLIGGGIVSWMVFFIALGPVGPCATGPQMALMLLGLFGIAAGLLVCTLAILALVLNRHKRNKPESGYQVTQT